MTDEHPAARPRGVPDAKTAHKCAHWPSATAHSTSTRSTLPAFLGGGAHTSGRPVAARVASSVQILSRSVPCCHL